MNFVKYFGSAVGQALAASWRAFRLDNQSSYTRDEILFYDALANNESAVREMEDETLRLMVKRILRKYKYPPDMEESAVELVLQQAHALGEEWVGA